MLVEHPLLVDEGNEVNNHILSAELDKFLEDQQLDEIEDGYFGTVEHEIQPGVSTLDSVLNRACDFRRHVTPPLILPNLNNLPVFTTIEDYTAALKKPKAECAEDNQGTTMFRQWEQSKQMKVALLIYGLGSYSIHS